MILASLFILVIFTACGDLEQTLPISMGSEESVYDKYDSLTKGKFYFEIDHPSMPSFSTILEKTEKKIDIVLPNTINIHGKIILPKDLSSMQLKESEGFLNVVAFALEDENHWEEKIQANASLIADEYTYNFTVWAEKSYMIVLNPFGKLNKAPFFIKTEYLQEDYVADLSLLNQKEAIFQFKEGQNAIDKSLTRQYKIGLWQNDRLISAIEKINEDGKSSIALSWPLFEHTNIPLNLKLFPIEEDSTLPTHEFVIQYNELEQNQFNYEIDLGYKNEEFDVDILLFKEEIEPIGNVIIYLQQKQNKKEIFIKTTADLNGKQQIKNILPGLYDMAVIPPFNSVYEMRVLKDLEFKSPDKSLLKNLIPEFRVHLQKRQPLSLTVEGYDGKPVGDVSAEFLRIAEEGRDFSEDIYKEMLFKISTLTSDSGHLCSRNFGYSTSKDEDCNELYLDKGRYQVHLTPPKGSAYGHALITIDFPKEDKIKVILPKPNILAGQIIYPKSKGFEYAKMFVNIYQPFNENLKPVLLGSALSDENGFFKALVSHLNAN